MISPVKMSGREILTTQEFLSFLSTARNFCALLETKQSISPKEFLAAIQRHLLILYSCGMNMRAIELQVPTDNEMEIPDIEMESMLRFIGESLQDRYYWHVFDPSDSNDTTSVCGDLVDDVGDMYKDIKRSLLLFDTGSDEAKENAIWQFKFDFESHWGDHCVNALYAVHYFLQRKW